jgi:hypothetical protein
LLTRLLRHPPPEGANAVAAAFPYRAVSVVPTRTSCPAAIAIRHTRFLVAEAPTLPLPMCTWPLSCPCRFESHNDRRLEQKSVSLRSDEPGPRKRPRYPKGRRSSDNSDNQ